MANDKNLKTLIKDLSLSNECVEFLHLTGIDDLEQCNTFSIGNYTMMFSNDNTKPEVVDEVIELLRANFLPQMPALNI